MRWLIRVLVAGTMLVSFLLSLLLFRVGPA